MTLAPEQLQAIAEAREKGRKITRATGIATFSGWTMAVFAFITLLSGLFSIVAFILGIGLAVVAWVELRGAKRMRQLDDTAPRLLGFNQIGLAVIVSLYCAWGIWQAVAGPSPYDAYLAQGGATAEMMGQIDDLNRAITSLFYAALLCASVIAQGCTALYYFSRRRLMVTYLNDTPDWVVETLRIAA
jgi:hypothetical protein